MGEYQIRKASWDDEAGIGALLTVSFADDPFARWILPNAMDFIRDSQIHARRTYSEAFHRQSIYVLGNYAGAVLWLPPGTEPERDEETRPSDDTEKVDLAAEFPELLAKSAAYRPAEPHWYLALIAVDPAHRGKGLGTALIQYSLDIYDQDGLPTYLESTNRANLSLYRRFGFELLDEVRVGNSPARYPMLRPAQ